MVSFIDAHRGMHEVEPICSVLPIAPSTYYERLAKRADPARLSDCARRDEALRPEIRRVFEENWRVYGVQKVWRQLCREGFDVARCTAGRTACHPSAVMTVRGFWADRAINGIPVGNFVGRNSADLSPFEQVEVLKGPAARHEEGEGRTERVAHLGRRYGRIRQEIARLKPWVPPLLPRRTGRSP